MPVGDVGVGLGVTVLLGQAEIDDIHLVGSLAQTHQEIVGLDVTMNEALAVHVLHPRYLNTHTDVLQEVS